MKKGYTKGDRTKHILSNFFFTHDLQKNGDIDVQQIRLSDNPIDLFTKVFSILTFEKLTRKIGLCQLRDLK